MAGRFIISVCIWMPTSPPPYRDLVVVVADVLSYVRPARSAHIQFSPLSGRGEKVRLHDELMTMPASDGIE